MITAGEDADVYLVDRGREPDGAVFERGIGGTHVDLVDRLPFMICASANNRREGGAGSSFIEGE